MAGLPIDTPLDETQWHSSVLAQQMQGIHSNSVLFYFAESPFFDRTSNNAVLFNQAQYNQHMLHIIATREAFEGRLKTMSGLEFIVAQEPAEMAPGLGTGVWVIRKQTRRKRQGLEDEITLHSTYFVVGLNVYMAPAVGDIIGSHLLLIFNSLDKFFSTASTLPDFTPALGNTYLPPPRPRNKTTESQLTQVSKENTPMPDSVMSTAAKKSSSGNKNNNIASNDYLSTRLLSETLDLTFRYADEYMDENPITGHPGDFHLSTTGRKGTGSGSGPRKPNAKALPTSKSTSTTTAAAATAAATSASSSQSQNQNSPLSRSSSSGPSLTPTEKVTLDTSGVPPARKGSKGDKSPKTPGMPKPKRRKSKALVSAGGAGAGAGAGGGAGGGGAA